MSHMQSKLDELAKKEEELRRINDALNVKKTKIMADDPTESNKKSSSRAGGSDGENDEDDDLFKGKNLAGGKYAQAIADFEAQDDDDEYGDGNFENETGANTGKSSKIKAAAAATEKFQMRMMDDDDEDVDISAAVAAGKRAAAVGASNEFDDDSALQSSMYAELKRKYDAMLADQREQDKTVNF